MADSLKVTGVESRAIDRYLDTSDYEEETVNTCYITVPSATDEISIILGAVSPLLDDMDLYGKIQARL